MKFNVSSNLRETWGRMFMLLTYTNSLQYALSWSSYTFNYTGCDCCWRRKYLLGIHLALIAPLLIISGIRSLLDFTNLVCFSEFSILVSSVRGVFLFFFLPIFGLIGSSKTWPAWWQLWWTQYFSKRLALFVRAFL